VSFDFNRISMLLHVEEKTRGLPSLKTIYDAVMDELHEIANPTVKVKPEESKADEQPELELNRRV